MVKRQVVASTLLALATAVALGACDGESSSSSSGYTVTGGGESPDAFCGLSQSCATCTPKNGCGWCYDSDGTGQCVSSPTECTTQVFEWTWNPEGCRVPAHAAIASSEDAGTDGDDAGGKSDAGAAVFIGNAGDAGAADGVASSACLGPSPGDASAEGAAPCVVETP